MEIHGDLMRSRAFTMATAQKGKRFIEYRVNIGKAGDEWNAKRIEMGFQTHEPFALFLLEKLKTLIPPPSPEEFPVRKDGKRYDRNPQQQPSEISSSDAVDSVSYKKFVESTAHILKTPLKDAFNQSTQPSLRDLTTPSISLTKSSARALRFDSLPTSSPSKLIASLASTPKNSNVVCDRAIDCNQLIASSPTKMRAFHEIQPTLSPIGYHRKLLKEKDEIIESDEEFENDEVDKGVGNVDDDKVYHQEFIPAFGNVEELPPLLMGAEDSNEATSVVSSSTSHPHDRQMVIVDLLCLSQLVKKAYRSKCRCDNPLHHEMKTSGTAVTFKWSCEKGLDNTLHSNGEWKSQLPFEGIFSGNLAIASAILLSGNNFASIAMFCKHANIQFFSPTTFYGYQKIFIHPAVKRFWKTQQANLFQQTDMQNLILAGNGRNDSPANSAQYLTYSLADVYTKKIISCINIDARETQGKSLNLELLGFNRAVSEVISLGGTIKAIVTDAHVQIAAEFKKKDSLVYKVEHDYDVWHGAEIIFKKVIQVSQYKGNAALAKWAPHIRNHFRYCSEHCKGDIVLMRLLWSNLLKYVCNIHDWNWETIKGNKLLCAHGPLNDDDERETEWLEPFSPTFTFLQDVVLNKRFLDTLPKYKNYRHTRWLESFHNLILVYTRKMESITWIGYELRILIALIDHNAHLNRPHVKSKKDGKLQYRHHFSRRNKTWTVQKIYTPKTYPYINDLKKEIFATTGNVTSPVPLDPEDPRRIFST